MIVDFHTHTFPDELADRAVGKLAQSSGMSNYLDGRKDSLINSMKDAGIDYSVILPVVTKPEQCSTVNSIAYEINQHTEETGLISFAGIHPDNTDYKTILSNLSRKKFKGIKLHPVFQKCNIDDKRYLKLIECAYENDLAVLIHAGRDISFPGCDEAAVWRIISMIKAVPPHKLVLAHMGGWGMWDEVEPILGMENVWLDTAFCLKANPDAAFLNEKKFCDMVKKHGAERVLFGTDSPWLSQKETVNLINNLELNSEEKIKILGENAKHLLNL
ncbi:MAG: amidohydrolase family protein [Lachnospira sp.]